MKRANPIIAACAMVALADPAFASGCLSNHEIAASRAHWAAQRNQPISGSATEASCRLYAGSFYELVKLRRTTAACVGESDREQNLAVLDAEIDAFNNLLAMMCGS